MTKEQAIDKVNKIVDKHIEDGDYWFKILTDEEFIEVKNKLVEILLAE